MPSGSLMVMESLIMCSRLSGPFTAFHPACNYLRPGRTLHRSLRGAPTKHGLPAVAEKGRLGFAGSRSRGLGWIWHCKAWAFRATIGFQGMRGHYRMRG